MPDPNCYGAIEVVAMRVSALDADGTPVVGNYGYVTANVLSVDVKPTLAKGAEEALVNQAGVVDAYWHDCDRLDGFDITVQLCADEPDLVSMLVNGSPVVSPGTGIYAGDSLLVSGLTGATVGVEAPTVTGDRPNGVCVEFWELAWDQTTQAASDLFATAGTLTYWHHVFPRVRFWPGDVKFSDKFRAPTITGHADPNVGLTTNGPFNDWDDAVVTAGGFTGLGGWFLDDEIPVAACGVTGVQSETPVLKAYGAAADLAPYVGVARLSSTRNGVALAGDDRDTYGQRSELPWSPGGNQFYQLTVTSNQHVLYGNFSGVFHANLTDMSFMEIDSVTELARRTNVATDKGFNTVLGPGLSVGGADLAHLVTVQVAPGVERVMFCSFSPYTNPGWQKAVYGEYPAIGFLKQDTDGYWIPDYPRSRSMSQLRAGAAHPAAFPLGANNSFGETVEAGQGFNMLGVLPASGHVVVTCYFQSQVIIIDPTTGNEVAYWPFPSPVVDKYGMPLTVSPRDVAVDPTGVLGDEKFAIGPDLFNTPGAATESAIMELSYNAGTATIVPTAAPWRPANIYRSSVSDAAYDVDGNLWTVIIVFDEPPGSGPLGGLTPLRSQAVACYPKIAGVRSYQTDNPPVANWNQLHWGDYISTPVLYGCGAGGLGFPFGIGTDDVMNPPTFYWVGIFGKFAAVQPNSRPPVQAANVLLNSTFAADVSDWAAAFGSATLTWDAGAGGRAKLVSLVNGDNQMRNTSSYAVPAACNGCLVTVDYDLVSARTTHVVVESVNVNGTAIANTTSRSYPLTASSGTFKHVCPIRLPDTATAVRVTTVIEGCTIGEVNYIDNVTLSFDDAVLRGEAAAPFGPIAVQPQIDSQRRAWTVSRSTPKKFALRWDLPRAFGEIPDD